MHRGTLSIRRKYGRYQVRHDGILAGDFSQLDWALYIYLCCMTDTRPTQLIVNAVTQAQQRRYH